MNLVFATNNLHKLQEVQQILGNSFGLLSLDDINCKDEIPETGNTLTENASEKAWYVFNKYKMNCFADDTGLEIDALAGRPGIYSARYAGEQKNTNDNVKKVLEELQGKSNRKARFRCVISLIINEKEMQFEGIINGSIINYLKGSGGFGYDPIFIPDGYTKSFAELTAEEKNIISHRGIAMMKLTSYLNNL